MPDRDHGSPPMPPPAPPSPKPPERGYETRDVDLRRTVWAGLFLVGVAVLAALAMVALFGLLARREEHLQVSRSPLAATQGGVQPPEPRLESVPQRLLEERRKAEGDILEGYGWVDARTGVVRIPIASAMEIVLHEGLPARTGADVPAAAAEPAPSAPAGQPSGAGEAAETERSAKKKGKKR